jgi:EpsD family peptidyl-prolyl cis-trans isomerase
MNSLSKQVLAPTTLRVAAVAAAAVLVLLAGCGEKKSGDKASQTAAKVNKEEITVHQINFVLQRQQGLKPEQAEAASKQILERLIDQELAVQKAQDMKLDRDPKVVQQIEAAKREIISRAYVERLGEGATKPTPEELQKYYDEKPNLFKDRRVYSLQELAIEAKPEQVETLRAKLAAAKNIAEFVEYMKANDIRFAGNQAVRAAEQLPLAGLDTIARMKDGESMFNPTATGVQVLVLAGSRSQPVDLERAKPAIEQFLLNERKRKLIEDEVKSMRANSKIEYVGKFAESAPPAGSAASTAAAAVPAVTTTAPAPAPAATPAITAAPAASSGMSDSDISKGMGLKK